LGFTDFRVRLNDRRLLSALLSTAGVPEPLETDALIALDKLDKIGAEGVTGELMARGIEPASAARCMGLFAGPGNDSAEGMLDFLRHELAERRPAVDTVATIWALLESTPAA